MTMGRVLLFLPVLESERMEPSTAEERTGPFSACTGGICIRRGREALLRRVRNRSRGGHSHPQRLCLARIKSSFGMNKAEIQLWRSLGEAQGPSGGPSGLG